MAITFMVVRAISTAFDKAPRKGRVECKELTHGQLSHPSRNDESPLTWKQPWYR